MIDHWGIIREVHDHGACVIEDVNTMDDVKQARRAIRLAEQNSARTFSVFHCGSRMFLELLPKGYSFARSRRAL